MPQRLKIAYLFLLACISIKTLNGLPVSGESSSQVYSENELRERKAKEMLSYMNDTSDPCEDFYEFACGNYAQQNPIQQQQQYGINPLEILDMDMRKKLKEMLEKNSTKDSLSTRQVKNFYRSCLHTEKSQSSYAAKLRELINEIGTMPWMKEDITGANEDKTFDWSHIITQIQYNTGIGIIMDISADRDFKDHTKIRLYVGEPKFALQQKSLYLEQEFERERQSHIKSMVTTLESIFGENEEEDEDEIIWKVAEEILDFEIALAQQMSDGRENTQLGELLNLTEVTDLKKKFKNHLDFEKVIRETMGFVPHEDIYVQHAYIENALTIISQTPARIVANYIFFTYVNKFVLPFARMNREGFWLSCLDVTKEYFYKKLDNMLYRNSFDPEMVMAIQGMWLKLKATFGEIFLSPRLQWMKRQTKDYALQKLNKIRFEIKSYATHNFSQEYSELNLKDNDYIENLKSLLKWRAKNARNNFNKNQHSIDYGATSSNGPIYSDMENSINLPVGFLQPTYFWSPSYAQAYNFATLGSAIAHEIIHAFDDKGCHFDALGNERPWWDIESEQEFQERKKCFIDQYQKYTNRSDILVPAKEMQGENIADNGGIHLSYTAYSKWLETAAGAQAEMENFPGLNYTATQLFFISYGQVWCSNLDSEYDDIQQATGNYAPERFRAIGPVSNYEEFAKAFRCPLGSAMNPIRKCVIY
ncbi:neprilysin-4-like [Stomoxys calcitrans]|uniref:neprilysin-4-like n=1 Tax=Stomoxys calcitrans TaxID=35570 RepID=UPI0027E2CCCF|nr:neprilysin-4-like [Stomoxys calcitrans]